MWVWTLPLWPPKKLSHHIHSQMDDRDRHANTNICGDVVETKAEQDRLNWEIYICLIGQLRWSTSTWDGTESE